MSATANTDITPLTPFLKWVGGKSQLMEHLIHRFPTKIHSYYEPFLGGGSVLLTLLHRLNTGQTTITGEIFACDANPLLINVFVQIKKNPIEFHKAISDIINKYSAISTLKGNRKPDTEDIALLSKE